MTEAEPCIPLKTAVIEVDPRPTPVTNPSNPGILPTCAIVVSAEVKCAGSVQSWVVPSLKPQVAVSCTVVPLAIEGLAGVTVIEVKVAEVIVTVVEPAMPLRNAVIVVPATVKPVTRPWVPETLLTWAIVLSAEDQLT